MKPYATALKERASELKDIWGNLIQRTWHMADQTWIVVKQLNRDYKISHWMICRDLARLIGGVATDTIWGYYLTIEKLHEIKATNLIRKPFTGFTQAKAVIQSGVVDSEARRILQWAYTNDSKRDAKKISVQEIKAKCEISLGRTPPKDPPRTRKFSSKPIAAVVLRKYVARLIGSFPETATWKETGAVEQLALRLEASIDLDS